jgi:Zn-dependent protease with chaperone function
MKLLSRAALAVLLLLGVYALAIGLAGGLVWLVVLAVSHGLHGVLAGKLVFLAAVTAFGLLVSLLRRTRSPGLGDLPGVVLPASQHPTLWREVTALAGTVGTRPPDEIRLVPDVNAAVTEETRMLGLAGGRRVMLLGAPLLVGLTRQQLRSVLAHELGHYSGRHTALGAVTYRGQEAIASVVRHFGTRSLAGGLFALYARLYAWVTFAVRRAQELEADDAGVRVAGRDAAAGALVELPVLDAAWQHYLEEFVGPAHQRGRRPASFYGGFAEVVTAPGLQPVLATYRTDPEEPPAGRFDSHPPLSARIERLLSLPADHVPDDRTPALALVDDVEGALQRLEQWMYADSGLPPASWEELLHAQDAPEAREHARLLYRSAGEIEGTPVTLGRLVESVRGYRLADYVLPLLADPTPEAVQESTRVLLEAALVEALVSCRAVTVSRTWGGQAHLLTPEGRRLDPVPVVARATSSGDPAELLEWIDRAGLDPAYATAPAATPDEPPGA